MSLRPQWPFAPVLKQLVHSPPREAFLKSPTTNTCSRIPAQSESILARKKLHQPALAAWTIRVWAAMERRCEVLQLAMYLVKRAALAKQMLSATTQQQIEKQKGKGTHKLLELKSAAPLLQPIANPVLPAAVARIRQRPVWRTLCWRKQATSGPHPK